MYAIIKTGGKQYKVSEGDVITVEKLAAAEGDAVTFDEVLTVVNDGDVKVGTPVIAGAKVTGKVEAQGKSKKIRLNIFDFRLSDSEMTTIAGLDTKTSMFFRHDTPEAVDRFVSYVKERAGRE